MVWGCGVVVMGGCVEPSRQQPEARWWGVAGPFLAPHLPIVPAQPPDCPHPIVRAAPAAALAAQRAARAGRDRRAAAAAARHPQPHLPAAPHLLGQRHRAGHHAPLPLQVGGKRGLGRGNMGGPGCGGGRGRGASVCVRVAGGKQAGQPMRWAGEVLAPQCTPFSCMPRHAAACCLSAPPHARCRVALPYAPYNFAHRRRYVTTVMYKPRKRVARTSSMHQEAGPSSSAGGLGGGSGSQPVPSPRVSYHGTPPASPMIN